MWIMAVKCMELYPKQLISMRCPGPSLSESAKCDPWADGTKCHTSQDTISHNHPTSWALLLSFIRALYWFHESCHWLLSRCPVIQCWWMALEFRGYIGLEVRNNLLLNGHNSASAAQISQVNSFSKFRRFHFVLWSKHSMANDGVVNIWYSGSMVINRYSFIYMLRA